MSFFEKFNKVFDENGKITVCGRDACRDLIYAAKEISPNQNFGDEQTGYMNVANIKALYAKLKEEIANEA